jgi:hypothetical protein
MRLLDRFSPRMEARKEKGFGISPETAPLVIEALRLYARMHAGEPAKYKVERWTWRGDPETGRLIE